MNININDIKNGMTIIIDGNLCTIQEFQHVKPGKGPAFVRIKLKNLRTGSTTEDTYNTNIKITKAHIDKINAQYLYVSGDNYTFMKPPTKDLNVTIALALMSIVMVEIAGIKRKGVGGWLKYFTKPIAVITPINILEIVIKPLSLCMRLFGNIFGGFIIMELLKILVPFAVPIPFSCYFEIFDALLQAYVFVFLTSIYLSEAVEE